MSATEPTPLVDLSSYAVRLLRQWLIALPAALVVGVLGLIWTFTIAPSFEAKSTLFVQLPQVQSEAEATQQSNFAAQLAAADLVIGQNSPEIAGLVVAKHPDLDASSWQQRVLLESGGLVLTVKATDATAEGAVALANDTAEAFTTVMTRLKSEAQPALAFDYTVGAPASVELVDPVSGKLPRLIITVALAGVAWVLAMVVFDARRQRRA